MTNSPHPRAVSSSLSLPTCPPSPPQLQNEWSCPIDVLESHRWLFIVLFTCTMCIHHDEAPCAWAWQLCAEGPHYSYSGGDTRVTGWCDESTEPPCCLIVKLEGQIVGFGAVYCRRAIQVLTGGLSVLFKVGQQQPQVVILAEKGGEQPGVFKCWSSQPDNFAATNLWCHYHRWFGLRNRKVETTTTTATVLCTNCVQTVITKNDNVVIYCMKLVFWSVLSACGEKQVCDKWQKWEGHYGPCSKHPNYSLTTSQQIVQWMVGWIHYIPSDSTHSAWWKVDSWAARRNSGVGDSI